ncbi:MAG TPA: DUF2779 domain-containing protein [Pyrinomonadaceae bacterium]|nr:DUF2779 domain-containing protein [Pyrinomonadaceae bacterium]
MSIPRYLTKSRFKLGLECPTKLYYTGKPDVYADQNFDDPFLRTLADGGFQVGELAKFYFPNGTEIGRGDYSATAEQTRALIAAGDCTIYEAAFLTGDLFIYADVVERRGNTLNVYEVKAKSIDPVNDSFLTVKGNGILSKWQPYLHDIAFQKIVVQRAFPDLEVKAHLVLVDKTSKCPTDGLNQKFRTKRINGRTTVVTTAPTAEDLSQRILHTVNVDEICDGIYAGRYFENENGMSFEGTIDAFAAAYREDRKLTPVLSKGCRDCEFRTTSEDEAAGLKSGFKECWSSEFDWTDGHFDQQSVLDIWNFRDKDKLIDARRVTLHQITDDDLKLKDDGKPGLSSSYRQKMQVDKARSGDDTHHLDREGLSAEFAKWTFPLHFIDFETSAPVIPFSRGRRPYEGLAFQFSHHIVLEDGTIEHRGEFLHTEPGVFPAYDFLRALKADLETDNGTIFRYAAHENTFMNRIHEQITAAGNVDGADELIVFIESISKSKEKAAITWEGPRNMVDMLELVKRFYYDPYTRGSNSIKQVLPAILNSSKYLRDKYSQPIYGAEGGIKSLNFTDWTWVKTENGVVLDPYKQLPKMFDGISDKDFEKLMSDEDEMRDGGAAMTAYAKLQFEEMSEYERDEIRSALLRYCELDTLAMVMIYEAWREMLSEP